MDVWAAMRQRWRHHSTPQPVLDVRFGVPQKCASCGTLWPCAPYREARTIVLVYTRRMFRISRTGSHW
jgi:hypothetical protein